MLNLARTIPTFHKVDKPEHNNPRHDRCRTEDDDDQTVITSNLGASSQDKSGPPANKNQPPLNKQQAQQTTASARSQPEQAEAATGTGGVRWMSQVCNTQKLTITPRGELLPKFGSASPAQQIAAAARGQPEQAKAVTDVGGVRRMSQVCNTQKLTITPRGEVLLKFGSAS